MVASPIALRKGNPGTLTKPFCRFAINGRGTHDRGSYSSCHALVRLRSSNRSLPEAHERDRHRVGTNAVARNAAGGVGSIVRGILDEEIALTPGNFFPVPVSIPLERHRSVVP